MDDDGDQTACSCSLQTVSDSSVLTTWLKGLRADVHLYVSEFQNGGILIQKDFADIARAIHNSNPQ